jgi:hypothetical protein
LKNGPVTVAAIGDLCFGRGRPLLVRNFPMMELAAKPPTEMKPFLLTIIMK